jgi:hypothetical protein
MVDICCDVYVMYLCCVHVLSSSGRVRPDDRSPY